MRSQPITVKRAELASVEKSYGKSVHVYGTTGALCFQAGTTTDKSTHTLSIQGARANGRAFDWKDKIQLSVSRSELPIVTATILGINENCEFMFHGANKNKGYALTNQDSGLFVRVLEKNKQAVAVPIDATNLFYVSALFLEQIKKNFEGLSVSDLIGLLKLTTRKYLKGKSK